MRSASRELVTLRQNAHNALGDKDREAQVTVDRLSREHLETQDRMQSQVGQFRSELRGTISQGNSEIGALKSRLGTGQALLSRESSELEASSARLRELAHDISELHACDSRVEASSAAESMTLKSRCAELEVRLSSASARPSASSIEAEVVFRIQSNRSEQMSRIVADMGPGWRSAPTRSQA